MSPRNWLFGLILIVATTVAYQPAWNGKPIWDDDIHITSAQLRSLHGLGRIWTDPAAAPQYYPLLHTVFWIEHKLWGAWPLPYHLLNIALHALTALLLWRILERLQIPGAWLAAGIFALHPVLVESVAWISELKNTLSGALCAGSALLYLKYDQERKRSAYFIAFALFLAGVMTKTVIVTLPAVLLVIFWWKRGTLSWKRDLAPLIPFFVIGLVAGLVTVWVEQKFCAESGETFDFSLLERFLIAGRLFWFYLGELLWPRNLIMIYPTWNISQTVLWQYLFPAATLILFLWLWIIRKKSRGPLAAAICFLLMLFPVLGFFNLSFFMSGLGPARHDAIFRADHFQYLATIAIFAPVSTGAAWLAAQMKASLRPAGYAASAALLLLLASLTWGQSTIYRDAETCFRAVIAKNPNSATARSNLGSALLNKGFVDEAIAQSKRSIEIDPDYQFGHYNLAAALMEKGEPDEAIPHLRTVLKMNPNHPKAYYTLGNALSKKGEVDEAAASYKRALQLQPDFPDAHTNLANLLLEKGDTDAALAHYGKALALQPDNPRAHYNLAVGLVRKGELEPAIAQLRIALRIDPAYPDAEPLLRDLLARKTQP
ncbi:MAG TPA: tetratricopeptide repeat protein [Chthoniobacterales bacterium]|jgi:tetratricopeptide (TPR) repeat protein|nr:tetratricopeptide repeat protein [Chthoniobacterales bacterium]